MGHIMDSQGNIVYQGQYFESVAQLYRHIATQYEITTSITTFRKRLDNGFDIEHAILGDEEPEGPITYEMNQPIDQFLYQPLFKRNIFNL